jgi:hypothetical protein
MQLRRIGDVPGQRHRPRRYADLHATHGEDLDAAEVGQRT